MFVALWLSFLLTGIAMAVGVVIWAVKTRQFEEQERARYLPLDTPDDLAAPPPVKATPNMLANLSIITIGLVAIAITLRIVIHHL